MEALDVVKDSRPSRVARWAGWSVWSAFVGICMALLVNSVLYGRVPVGELLASRLGGLGLRATGVLVTGWWIAYGVVLRRRGGRLRFGDAAIAGTPLLLVVALPVVAIYTSDLANHYFYYMMVDLNRPKPLALLLIAVSATVLLQSVRLKMAEGVSARDAFCKAVEGARDPTILLFLAAIGTLQGSAYVGHLHSDFPRYWAISDAMLSGQSYPVTLTDSSLRMGGMTDYIIDLPFHPALLALSYVIFGHNAVASYLPDVASSLVLPILLYLLYRTIFDNRIVATSLTAFVILFPPLRFYALNNVGTDGVFFATTAALILCLVRLSTGEGRSLSWVLLGLVAAAVTLTRPEGVAYAATCLLVAWSVPAGLGRKIASLVAFALPVAAFSATLMSTYGVPWPGSWSGTMSLPNLMANWRILDQTTIPLFASSMRLSSVQLIAFSALLALLAFVGSMPPFHRPRRLALLMLPAWINLAVVFTIDPRVSFAILGGEFFRHISFAMPFLFLAAALVLWATVRNLPTETLRRGGLLLLNCLLAVGVLWNVHYLTKPNLSFGDGAGNLLGARQLVLPDIILQPYELPMLGFELVDGHHVATRPSDVLDNFQDRIDAFFGQFDAIRSTSGTAYQTASLYLYLAALAVTLLPPWRRSTLRAEGRADGNGPPSPLPAGAVVESAAKS